LAATVRTSSRKRSPVAQGWHRGRAGGRPVHVGIQVGAVRLDDRPIPLGRGGAGADRDPRPASDYSGEGDLGVLVGTYRAGIPIVGAAIEQRRPDLVTDDGRARAPRGVPDLVQRKVALRWSGGRPPPQRAIRTSKSVCGSHLPPARIERRCPADTVPTTAPRLGSGSPGTLHGLPRATVSWPSETAPGARQSNLRVQRERTAR
jgi:hypothetical protein